MLTREDGAKGLNFLTPEIFEIAKKRIAESKGMVDEFRLMHNMLSSMPMCFNLFGPMVNDHDLATRIFRKILPDEVAEVVRVEFEYAPEPRSEYLNDATAFDAFVEFRHTDNTLGFIGIETKLTEPFSGKIYDRPEYRKWTELENSPWPKESWPHLKDICSIPGIGCNECRAYRADELRNLTCESFHFEEDSYVQLPPLMR